MQNSGQHITFDYLTENDYPLWDAFVAASPQGTFFNNIKWARMLSAVFSRPFKIVTALQDRYIEAGALIFENRRGLWRMLTPLSFYPFSGLISSERENEKAQKRIARQLNYSRGLAEFLIHRYDYFQLRSHYSIRDLRGFQWQGCRVSPEYSYILPLADQKNLTQIFSQSLRRKIKAAEKAGTEIIDSDDPQPLIELYLNSYRHHGNEPPLNQQTLTAFIAEVMKLEESVLRYARVSGQITAGRIFIKGKTTLYDLIAGADHEDAFSSAFLLAESLRGFAQSFDQFDFLGAGHPQVEQFKRGFGGKLQISFQIESSLRFPLSLAMKLKQGHTKRKRGL